jgi:transposase
MSTPSTSLPDDVEVLREIIVQQQAQLEQKSEQISTLEEYVRLLKSKRFGTSSERAPIDQLGLFNEAEATDGVEDDAPVEEAPETVAAAHTRKPRGRKPLPDVLPRVEILHDLAEDEKVCAHDGHALEEIGREISEQLEIIPATIRVLRHIRPKYACPQCKTGIQVAPVSPQPIPKSLASAGLLAHVAVSKYVDALPLYRQEAMLQRLDIDLPRATLANWMIKAGQLVVPLVNLIREQLLAGDYLQCDETRFQVLKESGKRAQSQSYLWVQRWRNGRPAALAVRLRPVTQQRSPQALAGRIPGLSPDRWLRGLHGDRKHGGRDPRGLLGPRAPKIRRGTTGAGQEQEEGREAEQEAKQG